MREKTIVSAAHKCKRLKVFAQAKIHVSEIKFFSARLQIIPPNIEKVTFYLNIPANLNSTLCQSFAFLPEVTSTDRERGWVGYQEKVEYA